MTEETETKRFCPTTGKTCYSRRTAGDTLHWFKSHRVYKKSKNRPMRAYICEFCGCYHLTHYKFKRGKKK